MVNPTTRSPRRWSNPATTELSTPPDIATAVVVEWLFIYHRWPSAKSRFTIGGRLPTCPTKLPVLKMVMLRTGVGWRQLSQLGRGLGDCVDQRIHLFFGIGMSKGKGKTGA